MPCRRLVVAPHIDQSTAVCRRDDPLSGLVRPPYRDRLCDLETVLDTLEVQTHAWRADQKGWVVSGMQLWKRPHLQSIFGQSSRFYFPTAFREPAAPVQKLAAT